MKRKIAISLLLIIVAIMSCGCHPKTEYKYTSKPPVTTNQEQNQQDEQDKEIEVDNSPVVYITKYGKRYHKFDCTHAKNIYLKLTIKQATNRGYTACYYCCY